MKEVVEVTIDSLDDLYEVYNKKIIKRELMDYIVNHVSPYLKNTQVELIININDQVPNIKELFRNSFQREYQKQIKNHHHNDKVQYIYLLVGLIILLVSVLIDETSVLHELLLIGGWFAISAMIEVEIFADTENKKRRLSLKKLKNCNIIVKR